MLRLSLFFGLSILILAISVSSCKSNRQSRESQSSNFNQTLADELARMHEKDQIAAFIPKGEYSQWSPERWKAFKDSVFTTHQKRLESILVQYGYPGYSLVGEEGSNNFWVMVQHCDHVPAFQYRVLELLKVEVLHKNADGSNFAYLTDRVNLNAKSKQVYGTQVMYNEIGQAIPRPLMDSLNVNTRRAEVGLEIIEKYLNELTARHFEMNKKYFEQKGILTPTFYKVD